MPNAKRLRILMLIPQFTAGGAERAFMQLARILTAHHHVTLAAFTPPRTRAAPQDAASPEHIYLDETAERDAPAGRVRRWWKRASRLRQLKASLNVDVSISFLEGADLLNIATRGHEHVVVSIRGSKLYDPHIRGLHGFLRRHILWPLAYPRADAVVSVSAGVAAEVARLGFVRPGARAETIGLALDVPKLVGLSRAPLEPEWSTLTGRPVVISWGRLSDEKGFEHLISVFSRLKARLPAATLVLIGDGPIRGRLVGLARSLSLSTSERPIAGADVIFAGHQPDPIRYAQVASAFVLPSLSEGFCNALAEALAAGLVVLATDGPWGARSLLHAGPHNVVDPFPTTSATYADFGILMPRIDRPEFTDQWVDVLLDALRGGSRFDTYRRAATQRAMDFNENHAADAWLRLLEDLSLGQQVHRGTRPRAS